MATPEKKTDVTSHRASNLCLYKTNSRERYDRPHLATGRNVTSVFGTFIVVPIAQVQAKRWMLVGACDLHRRYIIAALLLKERVQNFQHQGSYPMRCL